MSISDEIKSVAIEANKNLLWQKTEEDEIIKKETVVDNKYRIKTLLKMGERKQSRWDAPKNWTVKWFYDACYYEIVIETVGGYRLTTHTKRCKDLMEASSYHLDLYFKFKESNHENIPVT